jgi:hypothetical protein
MSLAQKHDTRNRMSADSEKSQHWSKKVGIVSRADCTEIKLRKPKATGLTFLEDFTLEHCLHGLRIKTIEIAGIF